MILDNEKEYKDAIESLEALCALSDEEQIDFEDDIQLLMDAIIQYENANYRIEEAPSWAILEHHVYDRLSSGITNLPFTDDEKTMLYNLMINRFDVPTEWLERVRALNVSDLIGE